MVFWALLKLDLHSKLTFLGGEVELGLVDPEYRGGWERRRKGRKKRWNEVQRKESRGDNEDTRY
jgi:hypothetical protein